MKKKATAILFIALVVALLGGLLLNLLLGSISIPLAKIWDILVHQDQEHLVWYNILWKSRLPQAITAALAGAALAVSGLEMQTVFRNPLADPSVLGVSSGASLGVAFVVLLSGSLGHVALSQLGYMGDVTISLGAIVGAMAILLFIVFLSSKVRGNVTLLIMGVMIGYVANAIIGILKFFSVEEDIRAYVIWGMGSFSKVSGGEVWLFSSLLLVLLPTAFLMVKPMNIMLLGDAYAQNLGVNIRRMRFLIILNSGVLVAIVTAYCGPIMFLGLAVPHLARMVFRSADHRIVLPAAILIGAILALLCNLVSRLPGLEGALPVNSVTALIGAPIVASILFRRRKEQAGE